MKKTIIAMAVAAVVSAPLALQAAPTLYGQANMMVQSDAGVGTGVRFDNTGSRIGLKGSQDLGNDLKAIYKLEFGVSMEGGANNLTARDQFVGLSGNFGTVLMGRHQTPLHMTLASDLFDAMGTNDVGIGSMGSRASNLVAYVSPSFGGVTLILAAVPNNSSERAAVAAVPGTPAVAAVAPAVATATAVAVAPAVAIPAVAAVPAQPAVDASSLTNITSMAITFGSKSDGLYLSAGMTTIDDQTSGALDRNGNPTDVTHTAFSAQYVIAGLTSNIIHRTNDGGFNNESTNTIISFGYEMGDFFPKIRYSMVEEVDNSNIEGSVISFGVDYALGKNTVTYIEVDMFDKDFNASRAGTNDARAAARAAGGGAESHTAISIGLLHKF